MSNLIDSALPHYQLDQPAISGFIHWLSSPDYGKNEREAQQITVDVSKYLYFASQKGVDWW